MNFISGNIENGSFHFAGGSAVNVNGSPSGPATLGVRPEDLLMDGDSTRSDQRLASVRLDVVEHMGHETMAHFNLAGNDHVVRLPADVRVQPGDQLPLSIRPGAYHLFDPTNGLRLN